MNKQEFRTVMIRNDDTQNTLSKAMGISLSRLNAKINQYQGADFNQNEMAFIAERYNLGSEEMHTIFFTDFVSQQATKERN